MLAEAYKNIERVNIVYRSGDGNDAHDVELPFRVLVVGSFTTNTSDYDSQEPVTVTSQNIDDVISSYNISISLTVNNRLLGDCAEKLSIEIPITSMYDFTPDGVVDNVPEILDLIEVRELLQYLGSSDIDNDTVSSHLSCLTNKQNVMSHLARNGIDLESVESTPKDIPLTILAEFDKRISHQLDEIMHSYEFMRLESSWRSLQFLLAQRSPNDNCTVELLSVDKEVLIADFEDVPEITHSRFYEIVYSAEFGQFGGRPYGVIVGDLEFGPDARDIKLAQQLALISSMAHAPFIAGADSAMFDIDNISDLSRIRDFKSIYEQIKFAKWNSFRQSDEARYFALTMPRFKLRDVYGLNSSLSAHNTIGYSESTASGISFGIWGNSSFAFATRLMDSFAKYRWCINITGVEDGKVDGISMSLHEGAVSSNRIPTQVLVSDRQLREISSQGFIPLCIHKGSNTAAFFASNSVMADKVFSNDQKGKEASLSHQLGSQLQYLFITCRIAQYLKMMQREHIGSWKNKAQVERELNDWIRQYVSDMDNPTSSIRAKRPLRRARIIVEDVGSQQDWYLIEIMITPHLKYMGTSFTLEETGKLDKR